MMHRRTMSEPSLCDTFVEISRKDLLNWRWQTIQEHLISLSIHNKTCNIMAELKDLLSEENLIENLNSKSFNLIVYCLLGIINLKKRDELIYWPVTNIQTLTKFRKGVTQIVKDLEKHNSVVKKLPESHFVNPRGTQNKILDFLLGLTSFALIIVLNDPTTLQLDSSYGLSSDDLEVRMEIISKAKQEEEEKAKSYLIPVERFEKNKRLLLKKFLEMKQQIHHLETELTDIKKQAVKKKILQKHEKFCVNVMRALYDDEIKTANALVDGLRETQILSKQLSTKLESSAEPLMLSASDFGVGETGNRSIEDAVHGVRIKLQHFHDAVNRKQLSAEDAEALVDQLASLSKTLESERQTRITFLGKFETSNKEKTNVKVESLDLKHLFTY